MGAWPACVCTQRLCEGAGEVKCPPSPGVVGHGLADPGTPAPTYGDLKGDRLVSIFPVDHGGLQEGPK